MKNWKLVAFALASTGALVLSAACSSSSSADDTTGAGGTSGGGLGTDCTEFRACCATFPDATSMKACTDAADSYASGEAMNPANVQTYEDACKSAVTGYKSAGLCGSGGAGGSGAGGSGGGTAASSEAEFVSYLGASAACDTCIKGMTGMDTSNMFDCSMVVAKCDADVNCSAPFDDTGSAGAGGAANQSVLGCLDSDHKDSPTKDINCLVEGCVGTNTPGSELLSCIADKCSADCKLVAGFKMPTDPECK